ncbi:hypothetical protein ACVBEQ_15045 [Nakamurella sp. GG22]
MNIRAQNPEQGLDSSGRAGHDGPARQLSDIARLLQAEPDLEQTLKGIVRAAVDNVAGADFAGITLRTKGGALRTPAVSDAVVEAIDRLQYEVGQGPCVSSAWDGLTIRSDDLRSEQRWPAFAPRAADLGVQSMLAFQLSTRTRSTLPWSAGTSSARRKEY